MLRRSRGAVARSPSAGTYGLPSPRPPAQTPLLDTLGPRADGSQPARRRRRLDLVEAPGLDWKFRHSFRLTSSLAYRSGLGHLASLVHVCGHAYDGSGLSGSRSLLWI